MNAPKARRAAKDNRGDKTKGQGCERAVEEFTSDRKEEKG